MVEITCCKELGVLGSGGACVALLRDTDDAVRAGQLIIVHKMPSVFRGDVAVGDKQKVQLMDTHKQPIKIDGKRHPPMFVAGLARPVLSLNKCISRGNMFSIQEYDTFMATSGTRAKI